jgi:uncharacterized membrane protein HdeD (DUF308 family)
MGDETMTLLKKNVVGLLLTLFGGLALAHGIATTAGWETLLGVILLVIGVALLALKIVRRNTPASQ